VKAKIEELPVRNPGIEVTSETEEEKKHLEKLWTRDAAAAMLTRNKDGTVTVTFGPAKDE